ncbi:MAG: tRNA lysidine(34) synthetase TilS [Acidimicrobiia bacterium]|nr:tRNA lysidine(34) synthetase TilS [Acidimicrobiia bacterium]
MAVSGGLTALAEAVTAAVERLEPGPVVVALSGGPDSAVAAWACTQAKGTDSVRAVHIDHGWDASAAMLAAAQAVADRLAIEMKIVQVTLPSGPSPEGIAREARLSALVDAAGSDRIVTGHHADDVAETVVGNLLRGAGVTGLAGIPADRGPFVRPLLSFRRSDLRQLGEYLELPFTDDPANEDRTLRRNLIRHELLPELDRHIQGELVSLLGRTASHMAAIDAYLDLITPHLGATADESAILVPTAPLVTAPNALAVRMVRSVLRRINPPYPGTSREVAAVLGVARGETSRVDLSSGWVAVGEGPHVAIYRPEPADPPPQTALPVPGRVRFGNHVIAARLVESGYKAHMSHDRARVAVADDLVVRAAAPGDRITLASGSKTVADAFNESAIPQRKRPAWPLVVRHARIVWIAGVRVAGWARDASAGTWIELERRTE